MENGNLKANEIYGFRCSRCGAKLSQSDIDCDTCPDCGNVSDIDTDNLLHKVEA